MYINIYDARAKIVLHSQKKTQTSFTQNHSPCSLDTQKGCIFIDALKCDLKYCSRMEAAFYNAGNGVWISNVNDVVRVAISSSMIMLGLATSRCSLTWPATCALSSQQGGEASASRSNDLTDTLVSTSLHIFYIKNIPSNSVLDIARKNRSSDSRTWVRPTVRSENRNAHRTRLNLESLFEVRSPLKSWLFIWNPPGLDLRRIRETNNVS